jgi:hypothetical protein
MNDRTAGAILLVIGVVAIFAAIVGGGIKIQQIEVGSVQSKWRQWLLGAFGLVIGLVGLIMVLPDDAPTNAADSDNVAVAEGNAAGADDNAADPNAVEAPDPNAVDENADAASADDPNQDAPAEDNSATE